MKVFRYKLFSWLVLVTLFVSMGTPAIVQAKPALSSVSSRTAFSWLDAQENAGIVYLLIATPPLIKRYQLGSDQWLSDIVLSAAPTTFRVTSTFLYLAYGQRVYRLDLDGTHETHLFNANYDVNEIQVANPFLISISTFYYQTNLISFDLENKAIADNQTYYKRLIGSTIAPSLNKMFCGLGSSYPSDIVQVVFDEDGKFLEVADSKYHGDFPDAGKYWVTPDQKLVIDDKGTVYDTFNLNYQYSLAGTAKDLVYIKDQIIVLRNGMLLAFSYDFLETGRANPNNNFLRIFAFGEYIYGFYADYDKPLVEKVTLGSFKPMSPGMPLETYGKNIKPDMAFLGNDGILYLLNKEQQSIFRWDVSLRRYLSTIPLLGAPDYVLYDAKHHHVYIYYINGSIYRINLNNSISETPFLNIVNGVGGWALVEDLFVASDGGNFLTYSVNPNMQIVYREELSGDWFREYYWNAEKRRLYYIKKTVSPEQLAWMTISSEGKITIDHTPSNLQNIWGIDSPMRVKEDGRTTLLGSGKLVDLLAETEVGKLPNKIVDGKWNGESLVTLRTTNNGGEIQEWNSSTYNLINSQTFKGTPLYLFKINEGWLVVTSTPERAIFLIYTEDFTLLSQTPYANFSYTLAGPYAHFRNKSEGTYSSILWNFGDGTTGTGTDFIHTYTQKGVFNVQLFLSGADGVDYVQKNGITINCFINLFFPKIENYFSNVN